MNFNIKSLFQIILGLKSIILISVFSRSFFIIANTNNNQGQKLIKNNALKFLDGGNKGFFNKNFKPLVLTFYNGFGKYICSIDESFNLIRENGEVENDPFLYYMFAQFMEKTHSIIIFHNSKAILFNKRRVFFRVKLSLIAVRVSQDIKGKACCVLEKITDSIPIKKVPNLNEALNLLKKNRGKQIKRFYEIYKEKKILKEIREQKDTKKYKLSFSGTQITVLIDNGKDNIMNIPLFITKEERFLALRKSNIRPRSRLIRLIKKYLLDNNIEILQNKENSVTNSNLAVLTQKDIIIDKLNIKINIQEKKIECYTDSYLFKSNPRDLITEELSFSITKEDSLCNVEDLVEKKSVLMSEKNIWINALVKQIQESSICNLNGQDLSHTVQVIEKNDTTLGLLQIEGKKHFLDVPNFLGAAKFIIIQKENKKINSWFLLLNHFEDKKRNYLLPKYFITKTSWEEHRIYKKDRDFSARVLTPRKGLFISDFFNLNIFPFAIYCDIKEKTMSFIFYTGFNRDDLGKKIIEKSGIRKKVRFIKNGYILQVDVDFSGRVRNIVASSNFIVDNLQNKIIVRNLLDRLSQCGMQYTDAMLQMSNIKLIGSSLDCYIGIVNNHHFLEECSNNFLMILWLVDKKTGKIVRYKFLEKCCNAEINKLFG